MKENVLRDTFIAEALKLMETNELELPDLGPFEDGDIVLDELTELEKALLLVALHARMQASKTEETIEDFCRRGESYPSYMVIAQNLLENKAEFVTLCAKFLFLQRLELLDETGISLRHQGVIVVNEEHGREEVISGLLSSAESLLPGLLGKFFGSSQEPD